MTIDFAGRRTIHDYTTDPVDDAALTRALDAAQWAPCHKLTWPWRFIRVGPEARARLVDLNIELKTAIRPRTDELVAKIRSKMLNPHILLAVAQVRSDSEHRTREDYAAISCAIQNLFLSLHSDGIGSKWSTGGVTDHVRTYDLLGVDPTTHQLVGFLWIGHAAVTPSPPRRPPLSTVLDSVP